MANLTRILNNQIFNSTIIASQKIAAGTITGSLFASNVTVPGDLLIAGNLFVLGTSAYTTIASTNTFVNDPLVTLNNGFAGSNTYDEGLIFNRGSLQNRAIIWSEYFQEFRLIGTTEVGTTYGNVVTSNFANLHIGNLIVDYTITHNGNFITNGFINTTGNVSAAVGLFGAINSTGLINTTGNVSASQVSVATLNATGLINTLGNISASQGSFATINATGFINTAGNISTAQLNAGQINTTGNVLATAGTFNALTVNGNGAVTGYLNVTGNVLAAIVSAASVNTSGNVSAATVIAGQINTTGNLSASEVSTATLNATGLINTSGNVSAAVVIAGQFNTTGNVLATGAVLNALTVNGTGAFTTLTATGNIIAGLAQFAAINSTPIGNATASTGAFTTLTATSVNSSGNVLATGGIFNALTVNGNETVTGYLNVTGNILGSVGTLSTLDLNSTTNATDATGTTGALQVAGGVSIAKDLWVGGNLYAANIIGITANVITVEDPLVFFKPSYTFPYNYDIGFYSAFTGSGLTTAGNVLQHTAIVRNESTNTWTFASNLAEPGAGHVVFNADTVYDPIKAGNLELVNTTASTTTGTGALIVAGGAGIGGAVTAGSFNTAGNVLASAITGASLNVSGNVSATELNVGTIKATGLINTLGNVSAAVVIAGQFNTTGNLVASQVSTATLNATGLINTLGNLLASQVSTGTLNATGFINTLGNISAAVIDTGALNSTGFINTTGNISGSVLNGGAINSTGFINTTGNISGAVVNTGALNATGTTTLVAVNSTGFINTTANISGAVVNTGALNATGTTTLVAVNSTGFINTTANVSAAIINTGTLNATGVASITNSTDTSSLSTGALIVTGGTAVGKTLWVGEGAVINSTRAAEAFQVYGATGNNGLIYADTAKSAIVFSSTGNTTVQNGTIVKFDSPGAIVLPVGSSAQRPGSAGNVDVIGMIRFSSTVNNLEFYDGAEWQTAGTSFTVISDRQFSGNVGGGFGNVDGTNTTFTLQANSTTAGTLVSINGVLQFPTLAYSVTNNQLEFTEPPAPNDVIDARIFTTTTELTSLASANGLNQFIAADTGAQIWSGVGTTTQRIEVDTAGDFDFLNGTDITYTQTAVNIAANNTPYVIATRSQTTFTSGKLIVTAKRGTGATGNVETYEAQVVTDGDGNAYITTYGVINNGYTMGGLTANVLAGNVQVYYTGSIAASVVQANVKCFGTYIL